MTVAVVLLALVQLLFIRFLIFQSHENELKNAESAVSKKMEEFRRKTAFPSSFGSTLGAIPELPYYITYIVYDPETFTILTTNDPLLPLLPDSGGEAKHFFEKNYFFDGDLNIIYYAKQHSETNNNIVIATVMSMDNNTEAKIYTNIPPAMLAMSIPILLLSFLLSLLITSETINPVLKITRAAQSITTENLSDLLPLTRFDNEIDQLSKTFNSLFLKLKEDFDRERQFSSDVSHELNTPLTVISGQANLLLRWGKENPEQLENSLNAIKTEAKTMQAIIANLLQISRIESGRIKPQNSVVSLTKMFNWIAEEFSTVAPDVKITSKPNGLSLETDSEMLHQILTVLVSNSVKFAGPNCNIHLNAWGEGEAIYIEETDDGPGFSEQTLPHIFERFYRGDESHTRKIAGSGLGLSIAQTLCISLGAKIKARNVNPHGASFIIEFKSLPLHSGNPLRD